MATPPGPPNAEHRRRSSPARRRRLSTQPPDYDSDEDYDVLEEDENLRDLAEHFGMAGIPFPVRATGDTAADDRVRAQQLLRGAMTSRRVASRSAISSLQSVALSSLPETERSKPGPSEGRRT